MEKVDARSIPAAVQERVRQLAVKAVLAGKKQVEVAKIFGVTRPAVGKWLKACRSGGSTALKAKRQGRPKGGSLLPWQGAEIAKAVWTITLTSSNCPSTCGPGRRSPC